MRHSDKIIIQKIISEISVGMEMLGDMALPEFLRDEKTKRAVAMTVINVGQLVKNVTDDLRGSHPEIPWKAIAGMRDIAAHKYQTLRMEDVYNTGKIDFPQLKSDLTLLLAEDGSQT